MEKTHNLEEILIELMSNSRECKTNDYVLYADYITKVRPDIKPTDYRSVMESPEKYHVHSFEVVCNTKKKLQSIAKMILDDVGGEKT